MSPDQQFQFLSDAHLCRKFHRIEASGKYLTLAQNREFEAATRRIEDMQKLFPTETERLWRKVPAQ